MNKHLLKFIIAGIYGLYNIGMTYTTSWALWLNWSVDLIIFAWSFGEALILLFLYEIILNKKEEKKDE